MWREKCLVNPEITLATYTGSCMYAKFGGSELNISRALETWQGKE